MVDIKSARYFISGLVIFFLTLVAALSAIFQTKWLVSIRVQARDYLLQKSLCSGKSSIRPNLRFPVKDQRDLLIR